MKYSKVVTQLPPSPIRAKMVRAAEIPDALSFCVGEPDFLPAPEVVKAARRALPHASKYPPGAGYSWLRDAYAQYVNQAVGTHYRRDEIIVTSGGMGALYLGLYCPLDPGDEVLISSPYFTNYSGETRMCGGIPVMVNVREENDFVVTADALANAVTPRTKVILLNSPCNPTGGVLDSGTLAQIAALAKERDLFVISDEVYRHIVFDGAPIESIAALPGMAERTLLVDSCSKSHAMTGYRVGFAAGPAELIRLMTKATENVYSGVAAVSQYAALEALQHGAAHRQAMVEEYRRLRDFLCGRLNAMDKITCRKPKGAFYVFANIGETGLDAEEFAFRLLEEAHVAVVPGQAFSENPNACRYIRISYTASLEALAEGMDRLEHFMGTL